MLNRAVHPGAILKDELAEIGVSPAQFARDIEIPIYQVNQILNGQRSISRDIALRIADRLGITAQFWMNLQAHFDHVHLPEQQARIAPSNAAEVGPTTEDDGPQAF